MSSRSQLQPKQGRSPSFQFGNPNVPAYSAQSPFTYSMQAINCMVAAPKAVLPMSTSDHEGPEVLVSSQEGGWVTMGPRRVGECTHKLLKQPIPRNTSICSLHPTSWYTHLATQRVGGYIYIYMCICKYTYVYYIYLLYIYALHICYTYMIYIHILPLRGSEQPDRPWRSIVSATWKYSSSHGIDRPQNEPENHIVCAPSTTAA